MLTLDICRFAIAAPFVAAILTGGPSADRAIAQTPASVTLRVPAGGSVKSEPFTIALTQDLVVSVMAAGRAAPPPRVRVYVHAEDGHLVGMDDPETAAPAFTFHPLDEGRYYVLLRNASNAAAVVRLTFAASRNIGRSEAPAATVRIHFATDRQRSGENFGAEPGTRLSYGFCDVSIPRDHRIGELEGPSIFRLEFHENPEKHVVLLGTTVEAFGAFQRDVAARAQSSGRRQALVFVHGFNVSFDDAARRTAQIAYDLAFDGPAILFSWPSQGGFLPSDYRKDERNAALSAESLRQFLQNLATALPQTTFHVIAHSMGNRVVTGALEALQTGSPARKTPLVNELALIAPDIDAELFRRAAGRIATSARRVTLYASADDEALALSQRNAGYRRAGQAGPDIVVVSGIDTIDATAVQTSFLGLKHQYYADNATILSDLFDLFQGRPPAQRFRLEPVDSTAGRFWRFRAAAR